MNSPTIAILAFAASLHPADERRMTQNLGEAIAAVHDVDGDGVRDLVVALKDSVSLYSCQSGRLLWQVAGAACALAPIEDVNADEVPDVLVGGVGCARILSGKDGTELFAIREPAVAYIGRDLDSLGDIDGDGHVEFLVTAATRATIVSTKPGVLAVVIETGSFPHTYCHPMRAVGDVDGDGCVDIAWVDWIPKEDGKGGTLWLRVVSARTQKTVLRCELDPVGFDACHSMEGWSVAPAGDPNGDGHADVIVSCVGCFARTYSGADGSVLVQFADPAPGGYIEGVGDTLAIVSDVNRDGVDDLAVGCKEYWDSGDQYYAAILCGRTGKAIRVLDHEHSPGHYHFVASPGDVDGDGIADVAVLVAECESITLRSGSDLALIRTLEPRATRIDIDVPRSGTKPESDR